MSTRGMPIAIVDVESVEKETDKALLCVIHGEEFWVPKSLLDDDSPVREEGDSGEMYVAHWWARKEGLIS